MILVAKMLFVKQKGTDQYANVLIVGLETLIWNVTNVGLRLFNVIMKYYQVFCLDECQVHKDCPLNKACKSQECVDPCLTTQCGSRAICEVDYHTAICVCPPGLQGNPNVACIEAGCSQNTDCNTDEKCEFVPGSQFTRKECQPLCKPGNCAFGADCTARDHRESCRCRFPLQGDGYAACVERKCIKLHQTESEIELHVFLCYFSYCI